MNKGNQEIEDAEKKGPEEGNGKQAKSLVTSTGEEKEKKGEIIAEEDVLPFDPELLEGAPPELRRALRMGFSMVRGFAGPIPNPLATAIAKVLDGDHLTALIRSMDRSAEFTYSNVQRARWTNLLYLIVVLIFAGFALWILGDSNPDLLKDLITIVAVLAGGLGAGYGVRALRRQKISD